jgi:osmoprotectant transport system substrate-binding protein
MIGDKNYTEQFVLGQLYYQALKANGFTVDLTRNIGPVEVTVQALETGRLAMYPEYLQTWTTQVAGDTRTFKSAAVAYQAGQRYALAHGLELLDPTPFSDTWAIGVTMGYADQHLVRSIGDLRSVPQPVTIGGPSELQQGPGALLPALEQDYGLVPAAYKSLAVGDQYGALDDGTVQAALVKTTDGQLASGNYTLLADPTNVFGWGQVVPVVSAQALAAEGPAFADIINRISSNLTSPVIRQLNYAVDVAHLSPDAVAKQFLETHGLIPPSPS